MQMKLIVNIPKTNGKLYSIYTIYLSTISKQNHLIIIQIQSMSNLHQHLSTIYLKRRPADVYKNI